jgi:hypothetical protein
MGAMMSRRFIQELRWLMLRQAQHEGSFIFLILSLSKDEGIA